MAPVNKPLWSPSYALVGGAVAAAVLAALDVVPERGTGLARALGANPILTYVLGESLLWAVRENVWGAIRPGLETSIGPTLAALAYPTLALSICIVVCVWLARRGVCLRI